METKYSFAELRKGCKFEASSFPLFRLGVVGDCSTQHLSTAIKGQAFFSGINLDVFDADYDQIIAQIMDPESELYKKNPNAVLIYMCSERLYDAFCDTQNDDRTQFAKKTVEKIKQYWTELSKNTNASILQFNFVNIDDSCFGNYAQKLAESFPYQLQLLNAMLSEAAQSFKHVYLINLNKIQSFYGRKNTFDEKLYYIAKLPLSLDILPNVAKLVIDEVSVLMGRLRKCVVLDLDNTLWGGTIGDDGLSGIQIGELGTGHAFTGFQRWLKELKSRGILLAVCSKNNEESAKEPFEKHPEMVLRLDDFAIFVANWEDKASNIRLIQKSLNIGFDSMVFFDDNPFERNLVKSLIPEITVPDLPSDPAEYLQYVQNQNLFETASYSSEDSKRTLQYQEEAKRNSIQQSFASYEDYLVGLEMKAFSAPFDSFHNSRIAQLTQRSNQFNLRTIRFTEAQIEQVALSPAHITRYYSLRDKFGDYGLISVVILEKREESLFISEWLMSCRVLKRGMEEFIVNDIVSIAKREGYRYVIGEYIKTPKNAMVADIYKRMGFEESNGNFVVKVDEYKNKVTVIRREQI